MKITPFLLAALISPFIFCSAEEKDITSKPSLEMQRTGFIRVENMKIPLFHLHAQDLVAGEDFTITNCNAHNRSITVLEATYLGNGKIKNKLKKAVNPWAILGKKLETFAPIWVGGFGQGEPSEFHLLDSSENIISKATYIPYPIEATATDGAKISLSTIDSLMYKVDGENFVPNEKIEIISISESEKVEGSFAADAHGRVTGVLLINANSPKAQNIVTIKRKEHSLVLKYEPSSESIPRSKDNPMIIFTVDHTPSSEEMETAKLCEKLLLLQF
jgi:hypothetical protein